MKLQGVKRKRSYRAEYSKKLQRVSSYSVEVERSYRG